MPIDPEINEMLKEMWRIDELLQNGGETNYIEDMYYADHLDLVQKYYCSMGQYWLSKELIKS